MLSAPLCSRNHVIWIVGCLCLRSKKCVTRWEVRRGVDLTECSWDSICSLVVYVPRFSVAYNRDLNDWTIVNNKLERMWWEAAVAYSNISWQGLRKTRETSVRIIGVKSLPVMLLLGVDIINQFRRDNSSSTMVNRTAEWDLDSTLLVILSTWGTPIVQSFHYSTTFRKALGPTVHPIQWVTGALSREEQSGRNIKLTTHL
jgi:hypothetical protein